eukprot:UN32607
MKQHKRVLNYQHDQVYVVFKRLGEVLTETHRKPEEKEAFLSIPKNAAAFDVLLKEARRFRKDFDMEQLSDIIWALGVCNIKNHPGGTNKFFKFVLRFLEES